MPMSAKRGMSNGTRGRRRRRRSIAVTVNTLEGEGEGGRTEEHGRDVGVADVEELVARGHVKMSEADGVVEEDEAA